jgi:hypothetical protein
VAEIKPVEFLDIMAAAAALSFVITSQCCSAKI